MADRPGFTFSSAPPPEVSAYLRQKNDRPAFRYTEVWGEEHAHAFTVAKAVQLDVLGAIRTSLQTAIDEGVPYETWSRRLKPELQRLGWWGQVEMADPATGEVRERELGTPRRLETIYQSNLRSARASGQWERAQRTKGVLPFFCYQLGPSINHRPEHLGKEGVIRPVDDPFWTTWFPPNGWGCKCWVRSITRAEAERRGGVTPAFTVPDTTFRRTRDDGTTERVRVPKGIDPGWQTNPGLARSATLMTRLTDKLGEAGEPAARAVMRDFWAGSTPAAFASLPNRVFAPAAVAPVRLREAMGTEAAIVMVSSDTLATKLEKHGAGRRGLKPTDVGRVQAVLDRGQLVERDGGKAVYILEQDDGWYQVVVKRSSRDELIVSSFYPIEARRAARFMARVQR